METKKWYTSKTLWTGITMIIGAVGGVCTGQCDMPTAIATIATGIGLIFARTSNKPIVK